MQDSNLSANLGAEQIWHIQIMNFTSVLVKMGYTPLGQNSSVLFQQWHQEMLFKHGLVTVSVPLYSPPVIARFEQTSLPVPTVSKFKNPF